MNTNCFGTWLTRAAIVCAAIATAHLSYAQSVTYRLTNDAGYTQGCFEICACPISLADMDGRFRLTPVSITDAVSTYSVTNVNWAVSAHGDHYTGAGIYTITSAGLNRMELDLTINGSEDVHFDSGFVPANAAWPQIDIVVAEHGEPACFDRRPVVVAKPLRADITGDGYVGIDDLIAIINSWGACPPMPATCAADVSPAPEGNRVVNVDDLLAVIAEWN